jgi:hypothetical protein
MEEPMDDRERIARVEATVDAHSKQFDRIDQSMRDLRDTMDRGFAEQRAATAALRDHTDRGFAELRCEMAKMTRWLIGITVTYGLAIVGILVKAVLGT